MFKIFSKKDNKIAELEEKVSLLESEIEGAISLKDITLDKYSKEIEKNKKLKVEIENLNKENRALRADAEGKRIVIDNKNKKIKELEDIIARKDVEYKELEKENINTNICLKNRLESIESNFKNIDEEFIKGFRKSRGMARNASNKRIRNKYINKMADSMEAVFKVLEEVE